MTVCTQAGMALLNASGDVGKAGKALARSDTLKAIGISVASAGLTQGIGAQLGLSTKANGLLDHMKRAALKTGIDAGVRGVVYGRVDKAGDLLRHFGASTTSSYLASHIGSLYQDPEAGIDAVTHKILHTAAGALSGAILTSDGKPWEGAAAGALGAFVAETISDMVKPDKPCTTSCTHEKLAAYEQTLGRTLTEDDFYAFYAQEMAAYDAGVQRSYDFARLTAATTALLTGVDVNIADRFGTSAMDHNFIVLAYAGVMAASVGYSCYCVYKAYDEGGFYSALKVLGVEVACFAAGGVIVKMSAPYIKAALQLALAKNPGLEFMLGVFVDRLAVEVEWFLATHAGKTLQVAVAVLERPFARGIERGMQKIDGVVRKTLDRINGTSMIEKEATKVPGIDKPFRTPNMTHAPDAAIVERMNSLQPHRNMDCSEIADILHETSGKGRILQVTGKDGMSLGLIENGKREGGFLYHQVFTDGKYVYDPRLSNSAIPLGDWERFIRNLNPGAKIK